jgi:hypothetical protein
VRTTTRLAIKVIGHRCTSIREMISTIQRRKTDDHTSGTSFEQLPLDILAPGSLQCKLPNHILLAGDVHRDSDESQVFSLLT